jgi:hypothetical protein
MKTTYPLPIVTGVLAVLALMPAPARADRPKQLTVAIYAPSVELSTASRVSLVNDIAAAVESRTGIKTTGKAYSSYGDLAGAKPDFALLDPLCIAAHSPGRVLATAKIGGDTSRRWGVFAPGKVSVRELSGKPLAYVRTGCRDTDFIEHGVFFGLFRFNEFFAGSVAQADVNGAVVATRDMKKAAAVLAPASAAGGLELILAVDSVPNPGLILMNKTLDASVVDQVGSAVGGVGGGPIDGWGGGAAYSGLAARMGTAKKKLVLAPPERASVAEADVVRLALPKLRSDSPGAMMWHPPERRPHRQP